MHSYAYSYNEDGLRLRKTVNNETTECYYNGSVLMYMVTGSGSTAVKQRFSYDGAGNLIAVVCKNGTSTAYTYYYLRNAQGDIVKLIDSSGNTVGANQPFRYRGYVYDEETGWYYLQSRYYDPTLGRFISADVLLSTGQGILGHNSFAYCLNNPVNKLDDGGCAATLAGNNRIYLPDYSYGYSEEPTVLIGGLAKESQEYKKLKELYIDDFSSKDSHYLVIADVYNIGEKQYTRTDIDKALINIGKYGGYLGKGSTVLSAVLDVMKTSIPYIGIASLVIMVIADGCNAIAAGIPDEGQYNYYCISLKVFEKNPLTNQFDLYIQYTAFFLWDDTIGCAPRWCTVG